jgi:hypothetical protein
MDWLGLSGAGFAAALFGLGAVIIVLYLLKEQRRRATVPALLLWEGLLKPRAQAALSTRLRRILSLLLALLVLVCLLLALADLRQQISRSGRSVVILVDRSASMAASDEPTSRLAAAKRLAEDVIADIGAGDRALIASLDRGALPVCTWTSDRVLLRSALASISQSDMTGDLLPGIQLALNALHGRESPELHVISDGNLTGEGESRELLRAQTNVKLRYLRVGSATRNVAVTRFAVRSYPLDQRHLEGVISLKNFGREPEVALLSVSASGTPLYEETLTLPAGETVFRTLADLPWNNAPLLASIKLERPDALASDDHAHARLPDQARIRVLVVSEGNRYLEAALLLDEYLDVVERTPDQYQHAKDFDVVIFDHVRPAQDPAVPALYLGPGSGTGFFPLKLVEAKQPELGSLDRPYFDRVDRQHPSLRLLSLQDVNLARASRTIAESADHVIAETASRVPLIVEGARRAPFLALTFDVRESDLPLRPAWPLFLLRSLERLADRGQAESSSHLAGELFEVLVPAGPRPVVLESPAGGRRVLPVDPQHQVRFLAERAGLYHVRSGELEHLFAVNVDSVHEGAIASHPELLGAREQSVRTAAPASPWPERLWPWFVALSLLLLLLEWLSFHRRWTV